jgi:DNA repair protein RecO (recombination protein O)
MLDLKEKGIANFHIYFLLHLTKYLGFFPDNNYSERNCYFDLKAGSFVQIKPMHFSFLEKESGAFLSQMLTFSEDQHEKLSISYKERIQILEKVLEYYTLHNEGLSSVKSLEILKEVFH